MTVGGRDNSVFPFRYLKKCRFLGIFENYVISNTFNCRYTRYKPEDAYKNKGLGSKKQIAARNDVKNSKKFFLSVAKVIV